MLKIETRKIITTLFCLSSLRFLLQVMEEGQAFKLEILPHKPLLFLNSLDGASLKALLLGRGPYKQLNDMSTLVKLDISLRFAILQAVVVFFQSKNSHLNQTFE